MVFIIVLIVLVFLITVCIDLNIARYFIGGVLVIVLAILTLCLLTSISMELSEKGKSFSVQVSNTLLNTSQPIKIMMNNSALPLVKNDIIWAGRRGIQVEIIINRDTDDLDTKLINDIRKHDVHIRLNKGPKLSYRNIIIFGSNECLSNYHSFLGYHYKSSNYYPIKNSSLCYKKSRYFYSAWNSSIKQ